MGINNIWRFADKTTGYVGVVIAESAEMAKERAIQYLKSRFNDIINFWLNGDPKPSVWNIQDDDDYDPEQPFAIVTGYEK